MAEISDKKDCFIIMPISDVDGYPVGHFKPSHYTHLPPLYPIVLSDEHRERADELGEAGV